ncbi:hypothetical protein C2E23DRAFT_886051 [Lenzites betulinus]|nr:hypothetical protein C2E23DRAFT_886051 [Lenzites betulinus]
MVSSPGPMRPGPMEEDDCLPYTLPPGPYSPIKPDLSYAAIIGQAILASSGHALALQDIYEFITTVYPYYKRGEPTWMNSVRHALSTMAVFRKVQRDRSEGKSLWAVWDCDIPCFDGGGFKKSLCADMSSAATAKASRKRGAEETGASKAKRRKTVEQPPEENLQPLPAMAPAPMLPPYFPHVTPANPYHQPYYQLACAQQQVPADVLFPPLPPSSNYHRVISRAASTSNAQGVTQRPSDDLPALPPTVTRTPTPSLIEPPSSSPPVPELDQSLSCSSSPTSSSHPSLVDESSRDPSPIVASASPIMQGPVEDPEALWLQSDGPAPPQPGATSKSTKKDKGKGRAAGSTMKKRSQALPALPPPPSPTPERRTASIARYGYRTPKKKSGKASPAKRSPAKALPIRAPVVPRPITPPSMTASVEDIMLAMEQHAASGCSTRSSSPLSEVEVATMVSSAYSDVEDAFDRPSTPEYPPSSSLPSTPPQRLADLEAELFNFSPFKSPRVYPFPRHGSSPTFINDNHAVLPSIYTPRAPYLQPGNIEELMSAEAGPSTDRSPKGVPRTPKKTPLQRPGSSGNPRAPSPFGTPSRGTRSAFEDDLASFFQSPGGSSLFDSFLPGIGKSPVLYGLQSPGFGAQF